MMRLVRWPADMDERDARRSVLLAALINLLGSPLNPLVGHNVPGLPWWPSLLSSLVGGVLAMYVLLARRPLRGTAGSLVFIANSAVIVAALWITSASYAASPGPWIPFQANKLGALIVSFCAPQLWSGVLSILLFVGSAELRLQLFTGPSRARIPIGEPLVLGIFGAVAIVLLVYRLRSRELERAALRAQSEADAMAATARAFMMLSDLANTPLQTIELSVALLRRRMPDAGPSLTRIERALARLHDLSGHLRGQESRLDDKPP
jgi:hypothetical protein